MQIRLTTNAEPTDTILYVGIDWSEQRRVPAIERGWAPWTVRFPMCEPPYVTKDQMLDWARAEGLRPPRLYADGFAHNFSPQFGDVSGSWSLTASSIRRPPLIMLLAFTTTMPVARGVVLCMPAAG